VVHASTLVQVSLQSHDVEHIAQSNPI